MKLCKVWWDFDQERYSQEAYLLEEDDPKDIVYKETEDGHVDCKEELFEAYKDKAIVFFKETKNDDVFALSAHSIVKVEILEE